MRKIAIGMEDFGLGPGPGREFRAKLALASRVTRRHSPPGALDADTLARLLYMFHCVARASVPLMELADRRARDLGPGDPVVPCLRDYLAKHIEGESGHAEWLLEDLETLGIARGEVETWIPSPSVAAMVGAQYYFIEHVHPVVLLGYIAAIEYTVLPAAAVQEWMVRSGQPLAAFRTVLEHSHLDPGHSDELFDLLDCLRLSKRLASLLGINAFQTFELMERVWVESELD